MSESYRVLLKTESTNQLLARDRQIGIQLGLVDFNTFRSRHDAMLLLGRRRQVRAELERRRSTVATPDEKTAAQCLDGTPGPRSVSDLFRL